MATTCSICLDEVNNPVEITSCGHSFHESCYTKHALRRRIEFLPVTCPNCNQEHHLINVTNKKRTEDPYTKEDLEFIGRFESKVNLPIDLTSIDFSDKEKNDYLKREWKKFKLTLLASVPIVKESIGCLKYSEYVDGNRNMLVEEMYKKDRYYRELEDKKNKLKLLKPEILQNFQESQSIKLKKLSKKLLELEANIKRNEKDIKTIHTHLSDVEGKKSWLLYELGNKEKEIERLNKELAQE